MRTPYPYLLAVVLLAPSSLAAGPTATASAAAGDGYRGYVACSIKPSAKPKHGCRLSQVKAAFFLSTKRDATYKVCVRFPGKAERLCASAQPAPEGEKQSVTIATADTGKHQVAWYVGGKKVETWTFEVT